jgi:hypothetical protein
VAQSPFGLKPVVDVMPILVTLAQYRSNARWAMAVSIVSDRTLASTGSSTTGISRTFSAFRLADLDISLLVQTLGHCWCSDCRLPESRAHARRAVRSDARIRQSGPPSISAAAPRPPLPKQRPEELRHGQRKSERDQPVSDAVLLARVVGDRPFSAARFRCAITWAYLFAFAAVTAWFDPSRSAA